MKILHTGDWHLGKNLEGYSRIYEQKLFLDELCEICDENEIEIIIIAGDIYDTSNPSVEAESLFYSYIKKLSKNGKRAIIIISGNHDSAGRLTSVSPLAEEFCVIIEGTPKTIINTGKYGEFEITRAFEGGFEIKKSNERAVFITMPYPNERNINEIICDTIEEDEFQKSYSDKIRSIFKEREKEFSDETINIVVGHFYICNGLSTDSERNIQLGGSYAVDSDVFPEKTQYVAMGHLHRPQRIKTNILHSYYAGSPIQYSKSEIGYAKSVFIIEASAYFNCKEVVVDKVYLKNYKPIEIWKSESIEDAIKLCEERKDDNCFVFLEIKTNRVLLRSEIKELRLLKKDIIEIKPILYDNDQKEHYYNLEEKSIADQFNEFYKIINGIMPDDEVSELFLNIVEDMEEEDTAYEND